MANVAYELVPVFTITPEIIYTDNFGDDDIAGFDEEDSNNGRASSVQRNF